MDARQLWLTAAVFQGVAFAVLGPALAGPFVSDDLGYVLSNPYIHALTRENLLVILDPGGAAAMYTANYAPVHLLAHALEWRLFGPAVLGYHVVNVALHAVNATLLVSLLARFGIPRAAALALGAVFLVHPANVEAVAWIFQLKTVLGLLFSLLALILLRDRPVLASLAFGLALLSKISAAFALPVAGAAVFCGLLDANRRQLGWLGVWALLVLLAALPEFTHFSRFTVSSAYPDLGSQLRSIVAIAGRYGVMAFTGQGLAAFHETPPTRSLLDPWFVTGLGLLGLLGWRAASTLWRRSPEAVFWVWAAAGWAPISQIFPFLIPVADRYLYVALPGLLGGAFLAGRELWGRIGARLSVPPARLAQAWLVAAAVVVGLFAVQARGRAAIWSSPQRLLQDTARRYPEGRAAAIQQATTALLYGNTATANAQLLRVVRGGYDDFLALQQAEAFKGLHRTQAFQELVAIAAGNWIAHVEPRSEHTQEELAKWSLALEARGEPEAALAKLEEALAHGGPLDAALREQIPALRARVESADPPAGR